MPGRHRVTLSLPARPENMSVIRHVLGAFAEALRLPDDLVEDLRLAVTEACTNVVRHAYPRNTPARRESRSRRRRTRDRHRGPITAAASAPARTRPAPAWACR